MTAIFGATGNGEFSGGGSFKLENSTFVGMGTFTADMGVVTMSALTLAHSPCITVHAPLTVITAHGE